MTLSRESLARIRETTQRARQASDAAESSAARDITGMVLQVMARIMSHLDTIPESDVLGALTAVDTALNLATAQAADRLGTFAADQYEISLVRNMELIDSFNLINARQLLTAALSLDSSFRGDLLSSGHAEWYDQLDRGALRPVSALRQALLEVYAGSGSIDAAVKRWMELDPALKDVPRLGDKAIRISAEARARRIIRTEGTRIDTAVSVAVGENLHADKWSNLGVPDDRQSDECYLADRAEPMTLKAWASYSASGARVVMTKSGRKIKKISAKNIGVPSQRHPNCRCHLAPVISVENWSGLELAQAAGLTLEKVA